MLLRTAIANNCAPNPVLLLRNPRNFNFNWFTEGVPGIFDGLTGLKTL
jgi:hypothetical protein